MYELNNKIKNLVPYEPISGSYGIRLDANESPFNLPDEIMQQVTEAVKKVDFNRYPDPYSTNLTKAFADYYNIDTQCVTVGNGSDELISIIETSFLNKGDKLLVIEPDFSMYSFYSSICEVVSISLSKNEDLKINIDDVIEAVNNENASAVVFSNPCNPTAQGVLKKDIVKLIKNVKSLVVLDEAYMDFWDQSLINEAHLYDNLIVLRTASKAVGLAGLRLGFAIANKTITNALKAVKSPYNVNSISQVIGEVVYKNKEYLNSQKKTIVNNTVLLYNKLVKLAEKADDFNVFETCANFIFVKTDKYIDIFNYLIKNSVVIRKFNGYLRISSGTQEQNETLISLLEKYF